MQDKLLTAKFLADQCIVAGRLDAFFHELIYYTVQGGQHQGQEQVENSFFQLAALILKERYHLFIDEYLQMPPASLPEISPAIVDDMDSIDLFFEQYYNQLKERYLAENHSNAAFFRDYHRRDLKQDSMLRAFIVVRNRLLNPAFALEPVGRGIAYLGGGLTGTDTCRVCVKSFLTVTGMRSCAGSGSQMGESLLQQHGETGRFSATGLEAMPLESLPPKEKAALEMIAINKPSFRAGGSEYFCQFTWLLG